jgi:hypothetical protein
VSVKVFTPYELTGRRGKYCGHRRPEVCEEERVVTCKDCRATLDPIRVLALQAHYRDRLLFELRSIKADLERHRAELEELKRLEANCKARIRKAAAGIIEPAAPCGYKLVPRGWREA